MQLFLLNSYKERIKKIVQLVLQNEADEEKKLE